MSRSTVPAKRPADVQEEAWIADEDRFVLQQAKKKAAIRVKGGRAQPIDWLAVTLVVIDPERNPLDDEIKDAELDVIDPEGFFEGLGDADLADLEKGIDTYLTLESSRSNRDYWNMMKTISQGRRQQSQHGQPTARGVSSVATDLDKLLGPKSLNELEKLESQIKAKLASNEPMDTDYWEHLLSNLLTYKAKAKLRRVTQSIVAARMDGLRKQQTEAAEKLRESVEAGPSNGRANGDGAVAESNVVVDDARHSLDPEPLLRLRSEDKTLSSVTEEQFARQLNEDRRKIRNRGYIGKRRHDDADSEPSAKRQRTDGGESTAQNASQYDREVARGLSENEEIFTAEEQVTTKNLSSWSHLYRPRKPRYFNRMLKGYEWNKYNQTHYDHDNPPPRVVQGYKFNVFYPDLVDKTKAPTFKIEREHGRRRGETFAPAGEDDTCLIRFTAGAPYEDLAFRIVDREWDYSAKRERGFRSSFDKGILQLHFQFKKVFYRK